MRNRDFGGNKTQSFMSYTSLIVQFLMIHRSEYLYIENNTYYNDVYMLRYLEINETKKRNYIIKK